jgi:hypothetical protein
MTDAGIMIQSLNWDTYDIWETQVQFLMESQNMSREEAEENASTDDELNAYEWNDLTAELTSMMNELCGRWDKPNCTTWHAEGFGIGWQKRTGYLDFEASNGAEFLHRLLPDTDNTFTITQKEDRLTIINSHHDAMGERYEVYPQGEADDSND